MRHQRHTKKLGRNTSHRRALLRNLVTSLIMEERLETTPAKAKAMREMVEYSLTEGQKIADSMGYIPLPQSVVDQVRKASANIK